MTLQQCHSCLVCCFFHSSESYIRRLGDPLAKNLWYCHLLEELFFHLISSPGNITDSDCLYKFEWTTVVYKSTFLLVSTLRLPRSVVPVLLAAVGRCSWARLLDQQTEIELLRYWYHTRRSSESQSTRITLPDSSSKNWVMFAGLSFFLSF